jgi:hypothetical protein
MLSSFKDKNIGHSLGRLEGSSNLTSINYIKLAGLNISPLFEKYNLLGLSDLALSHQPRGPADPRTLFLTTIFK